MPPEAAGEGPVPHPRERTTLVGHAAAEAAICEAFRSGRLHHAWLTGGPRGIGKATLAYRAARFVLAGGRGEGEDLATDPGSTAARQIVAGAHPNLAVLERAPGAKTATITVDTVRKGLALFATTAADSGYRVCLVDAADDLNTAAANALLKVLEEPPPRSLFLLVSHAPGRLLPTIRSRCRRLALRPLAEPDLAAVVASVGIGESTPGVRARALALSEGSASRALALMDPGLVAVIDETERLLAALPGLDWRRVLALAESVASREADARHAALVDAVARHVSAELARRRHEPPARLAALVEVCEKIARAAREADIYNLDRRPLVLSLFDDLAGVAA